MCSRLAEAVPGAWPEAELRTANSAGGSQRLSDPPVALEVGRSGGVPRPHPRAPSPRLPPPGPGPAASCLPGPVYAAPGSPQILGVCVQHA